MHLFNYFLGTSSYLQCKNWRWNENQLKLHSQLHFTTHPFRKIASQILIAFLMSCSCEPVAFILFYPCFCLSAFCWSCTRMIELHLNLLSICPWKLQKIRTRLIKNSTLADSHSVKNSCSKRKFYYFVKKTYEVV